MKHSFRNTILIATALLLALLPVSALADDASADGAGNLFISDTTTVGNAALDVYGAGQNLSLTGASVGHSAILAGYNINVSGTTVGSSLRPAGYQINVTDTKVAANTTAAGYSVVLGQGFEARGVYAVGSTVTFGGVCDTLAAAGNVVTLTGTVNGDAFISADTVAIGENAVVTGKLSVTAGKEPALPAGAQIGSYEFTTTATDESDTDSAVSAVTTAATVGGRIVKGLITLAGRVVLVILYYFIIRKTTKEAGDMIVSRPAYMPVSGLITLIALPIGTIILMCTVIGAPAGLLLLCLYGLALAFSMSFAAAAVGPLVLKKMHPLLAGVIAAAAFSIFEMIPIAGGVLVFGAMIYTLGYFIQKIYLGWTKKEAAPEAPAAPAEAEAPAETPTETL